MNDEERKRLHDSAIAQETPKTSPFIIKRQQITADFDERQKQLFDQALIAILVANLPDNKLDELLAEARDTTIYVFSGEILAPRSTVQRELKHPQEHESFREGLPIWEHIAWRHYEASCFHNQQVWTALESGCRETWDLVVAVACGVLCPRCALGTPLVYNEDRYTHALPDGTAGGELAECRADALRRALKRIQPSEFVIEKHPGGRLIYRRLK